MPSKEGFASFREWKTWYKVTGNLASDKTPLVVLHGGPGCTHDCKRRLRPIDFPAAYCFFAVGLGQMSTSGSPRRGHFAAVAFAT